MAEETNNSTAAVTNFAEFEAAGGRYNPSPEPAQKTETTEPAPEQRTEGATAEEQPAAEKPAAAKADKPKLSLKDEHAKLLREVTDLRRERRELQQAPANGNESPSKEPPSAQKTDPAADKPPARPRLSTFAGSLEEYEEAVEKYERDKQEYLERQWERKQVEEKARGEQQRIAEAYGAKLAEHLKQHPEYDAEIAETPLSSLMVDIVLHEGPALGQALIDDKEEARRIQSLPRDVQIFEMGKIAARLPMNGNGKAAAAEEEPEAQQQPVKVPAKLTAAGSTASAIAKPGHGAKSFAEFEQIERRLAEGKRRK
jgi:hypothetical protein